MMSGSVNWKKARRAVRGWLGPSLLKLLEGAVSRRSWRQTQALARRLCRMGLPLHRRYRQKAAENIRLAFGDELCAAETERLAGDYFQHMAMLVVETLRMTTMQEAEVAEVVEVEGVERVEEVLAAGRGGVVFCGHAGNWEVAAVRALCEGWPVVPLSRPPSSGRLARAVAQVRERLDVRVMPVSQGVRGMMRALRKNQIVCIMADQFARGAGMTVPFFGRETHVWHTPALLAQRAGCPILPIHAMRRPDGTFVLEVDPPIEVADTGDRRYDAWVATAHTMAVLETKVRQFPEQYLWQYELWRPDDTPPPPYPFEMLPELPVSACAEQVA